MPNDEAYVDADGEPVRVSSPGKVMFPEQGWTKLDVVEHYLRCGPGVVSAVRGRPCMLKRRTKGVGERPFYQKRAPKDARESVPIRFPECNKLTAIVCLDLSAAFDTVNHSILKTVMEHYFGFNYTALQWLSS